MENEVSFVWRRDSDRGDTVRKMEARMKVDMIGVLCPTDGVIIAFQMECVDAFQVRI